MRSQAKRTSLLRREVSANALSRLGDPGRWQRLWQRGEKPLPLLSGPALYGKARSRRPLGEGIGLRLGLGEDLRPRGGGISRHAWLVDPGVELQARLERGVTLDEIRANVFEERSRGDRLKRVTREVALQVRVETLAAHRDLDQPKESLTLFVGHRRHAVVGVPAFQVEMEPRVGGRRTTEPGNLVHEVGPRQEFQHVGALRPVDGLHDAQLHVGGEPLVQPEVVPGARS